MVDSYYLWRYDIENRETSPALSHTTVNSIIIAKAIISSVTTKSGDHMSLWDAYLDLRNRVLDVSEVDGARLHPIVTTTQRDLLSGIMKGTTIYNDTTGMVEEHDGTDFNIVGNQDISCKVTKSSTQSVADSTEVTITWDTEDYDTDNMHDLITNNQNITIKTAGKYSVNSQSEWSNNSTGERVLSINLNGVVVARNRADVDVRSHGQVDWVGELAVDDVLTLSVYQTSGSTLTFSSGDIIAKTYFAAHKTN